jgi:hypothetical protein
MDKVNKPQNESISIQEIIDRTASDLPTAAGGGGGNPPPHPNNFLSDKELASKLLVSDLASNFPSLFYLLLKEE